MPFDAKVYKVFIASPSDVEEERKFVRDVINEWNTINSDTRKIVLMPVGWETHVAPEMGDSPQSIINKRILGDCDILVGIFWTRIGTSTNNYISGTVEEIEEHIKNNKITMLYFSNARVNPESIDTLQYEELKKFKESCKQRGIFENYSDTKEFKDKFNKQLQIKMNDSESFESLSIGNYLVKDIKKTVLQSLSKDAQLLLKKACNDYQGSILCRHIPFGIAIQTNRTNPTQQPGFSLSFVREPKEQARWEGALKELENQKLIESGDKQGVIFKVTREGYALDDLIIVQE